MGHLPRKAANREWSHPKRKKCIAVQKAEQSWKSEDRFDIRHGDGEFEVCPAGFGLALVQYFLTMLPSLCFGMVMYILCHYMLEVYDLLLDLEFKEDYSSETA